MQERVEVPELPNVTLVGDNVQVKPVAGDTVDVRAMVPVNPRTGVTLVVEDPETPARTLTLNRLREIAKSCTVKEIV